MAHPKELRKALRNVVQDLYPSLITEEMTGALYKELQQEIAGKLASLEVMIVKTLTDIDTRQKDIQAHILNQLSTSPIPTPGSEPTNKA